MRDSQLCSQRTGYLLVFELFFTFILTRLCLSNALSLADIEVVSQTHALVGRNIDSLSEVLDVEVHFFINSWAFWIVHKYKSQCVMRNSREAFLISWIA